MKKVRNTVGFELFSVQIPADLLYGGFGSLLLQLRMRLLPASVV
jgi:hypothetical protein